MLDTLIGEGMRIAVTILTVRLLALDVQPTGQSSVAEAWARSGYASLREGSTTSTTRDTIAGTVTTVSSDEEDPFDIFGLISWYNDEAIEGADWEDARERHNQITRWYEWCDRKYPGTESREWAEMASAAGKDVDIRLLIRGHDLAGFAILLFLEACYDVDKALCGTDLEALAKVKMWHMPQEMRAYTYLLSDEMILWWQTELSELETEIKSRNFNRVSLSWRVNDLSRCLSKLEVVMDCREGIGTNIWTTMSEENGTKPPAGTHEAIYGRVDRLRSSIKILRKALENSEHGDATSNTVPPVSHNAIEVSGIRKRIPRASSPATNEGDPLIAQIATLSEDAVTPASYVVPSLQDHSLLQAEPPAPNLRHISSQLLLAINRATMSITRYEKKGFLTWIIHKETVFVLTIGSVVISVYFMARSAMLANSQPPTSGEHSLGSDSSFLGNLSQSLLSYLSIYLVIVGTAHNGSRGLRYQSWLWLLLSLSFISSTLGLSLYYAVPMLSVLFLWAAAFAQVVIPVLLITMAGKSKIKDEDEVELHRD